MFKNVYSIDFLNYCIINYEKNIHLSIYRAQNSVLYMANKLKQVPHNYFSNKSDSKTFFKQKNISN